jgi:hypothetical protein
MRREKLQAQLAKKTGNKSSSTATTKSTTTPFQKAESEILTREQKKKFGEQGIMGSAKLELVYALEIKIKTEIAHCRQKRPNETSIQNLVDMFDKLCASLYTESDIPADVKNTGSWALKFEELVKRFKNFI